MASSYEARIMRVIDHIHDHPADDLSLDAMADLAAMSRFHWHRVFRGVTGETIAQAVRRIRMERAAQRLLRTSDPIALVARQVGYPNLQSFGRVFGGLSGPWRDPATSQNPLHRRNIHVRD
jgi:AraC family transcriptional regulator